jgi:hypothetical protein
MTAHAQTVAATQALMPAQTVALQQQLDMAKATLANLEMQAGKVPPADAGTPNAIPASIAGTGSQGAVAVATPSSGLSAAQIGAFKGTLSTLAATLSQLNASLAANTTLSASQEAAVQTTLNGMRGTLVAMATTIANGSNSNIAASVPASAPVAVKQPSTAPVAVNSVLTPAAPAPTITPTVAVTPTAPVTSNQPAPTTNAAPQTAQASSFWSFTKAHWPTIVIVLLVLAILAILFWPEKETVRTVSTGNSGSGKPKSAPSPITTATLPQNTAPTAAKIISENNSVPTPATPMSNAVAAPSKR